MLSIKWPKTKPFAPHDPWVVGGPFVGLLWPPFEPPSVWAVPSGPPFVIMSVLDDKSDVVSHAHTSSLAYGGNS